MAGSGGRSECSCAHLPSYQNASVGLLVRAFFANTVEVKAVKTMHSARIDSVKIINHKVNATNAEHLQIFIN